MSPPSPVATATCPVRYRGYDLWYDPAADMWLAESRTAEDAGDAAYPTYRALLAAIDATHEAPGGAS